ncbi:hypothetical protein [Roseateles sp.]|uniref:hypothetical protein n=1 Tax=Roseateles sp. TaxID=1971397 RepID=UPI0032638F3F
MTDRTAELVLKNVYGASTKQLLDLVMAAEKAFDDFGKRSFFGKDKGKEAEGRFTEALIHAIMALERAGKIRDSKNAEESFTALQSAMTLVRRAYPNWPRAHRYWDDFYANTYEQQ